MANKNTDYEKFVRDIQQALLDAQGLETVKVQHNVPIPGISRSHQVDVYWEYRIAGVLHRMIIDCKRYKNTVEVGDVLQLQGVVVDMPGVRGVIATTMGFQKGAVDYAKTHAIGLKVIRAPEDGDWEGRLREIALNIRIDPSAIVRDAIDGTLLFVDPDGSITGDVEEEIGPRTK